MGMLLLLAVGSFLFLLFSSASFLLINFPRSCPRFGGKCVPILAVGPLEVRTAFVFKEDEGLGTSQRRCKQRQANFYGASSLGYHMTGRLHGDERRSLKEGRKPPSLRGHLLPPWRIPRFLSPLIRVTANL